jgi:serine/threonine protein kinase
MTAVSDMPDRLRDQLDSTVSRDSFHRCGGRYAIGKRISGPEARVYEAVDSHSGTPCVVKFASDKSGLISDTKFQQRARLVAESDALHRWSRVPNVVRVLDEDLDARTPFLVLERLGPTLERTLPPSVSLELIDALDVVDNVALALNGIHGLGDVFYDVKPDNIARHPGTGQWTLLDPGSEDLLTAEYSSQYVSGWQADIVALGRTFLTAFTGAIDDGMTEDVRESLCDLNGGSRFVRMLDRMLARYPGTRGRPTAGTTRQEVQRFRRLLGPSSASQS